MLWGLPCQGGPWGALECQPSHYLPILSTGFLVLFKSLQPTSFLRRPPKASAETITLSQATWVAVYFAAISKLRFCFGCVYRERRDEEMDSGPGQTRILLSLLFISAMGTTRPTEKPSGAQKGCRESMRFPQTATRCLFSSTKSSALSAKDSPASLVSDSRPPPHACSQPFTADGFVVHSPILSRRSF